MRQYNKILAKTGYTSAEAEAIIEKCTGSDINIDELQADIRGWTARTFGDERIKHKRFEEMKQSIIDEARELVDKPYSLFEYADLFITMLNSMSAAGYTFSNLFVASSIKMVINRGRKWLRQSKTGKLYHFEKDET